MPLTDIACRNATCSEGRAFVRLSDSGGLYLEVMRPTTRNPAGSKLWRWKYRYGGKEKRLALGQYPGVSLAEARREHAKAREVLALGNDPGEVRKGAKLARLAAQETAFEAVARSWWAGWKVGKTERYAGYVLKRLEADAFPVIGAKPVNELTAPAFGERRPHLVPLAPQALEVLRLLQTARGEDRCSGPARLFPGERDHDRPMSNNTLLSALKRMGYAGRQTGHGFRGIASTTLNEMGFRDAVIEAQLSHVDDNKVRAAYNHAQYLDERRELMTAWADYLDAVQRTGQVIPFRQAGQARRAAAA